MSIEKKCVLTKAGTVVLPSGIITFAAIAKKFKSQESDREGDEGAYILNVIYPADSDFAILKQKVDEVGLAKFKDAWKKPGVKKPFLRADEKLDPERLPEGFNPEGWVMLRANTYSKRPTVIRADRSEVAEEDIMEEVYNGRWARMSVTPHAYDQKGNKGVKLYLSNVQVLGKGERWPGGGSRAVATDEFDAVELPGDGASADALFD
jgi:hypothetical protein